MTDFEHRRFFKNVLFTFENGPYNAGPKSALFLRVALIRAGVNGAGVERAIFKR